MVTFTELANEDEARKALTGLLLPAFDSEREKLNRIDRWWRWNPKPIRLKKATAEHRMLRDMGHTPWLHLVVTTLAQTLYLEGVDIPGDDEQGSRAKAFWEPWNRSRMSANQIALHQAAIAYGTAYTAVRAVESVGNGVQSSISCVSPREGIALYDDPAKDTFPQLFMRQHPLRKDVVAFELWDAWNVWTWTKDASGIHFGDVTPHLAVDSGGNPVCPIVRFTNQLDLEGRAPGEVEPFIALANRLNKDNYDRLLSQHHNSWKVRTATGLDMDDVSEAEREQRKAILAQDDILVGGADVKFGTLPETVLDSLIAARQADVEELAAVSQTPTTAFGKMVNVGDAGIEESRAGFYAKRNERRKNFGVSHLDTLRLCAAIEGRMDDASAFNLTALWEDTDTRTMSAAVDALGKAAQMLGVPSEQLWDMIPGVTKTRADSWRQWKQEHPDVDALALEAYGSQLRTTTPDDPNAGA
ncbi:MAG: phage portal protein [Bifidobacterium tsurumiense]|uniref:phage portal protein n=1 Tax=Bifidobacterium tsurumiense TaxID=356829 RepID=UPI002A8186B8|nr:phage portal protein [Bifidobacterium tsurumiense]MDY4677596.1 phage portal protein [Bifidobacterium tsurumiense]